MRGRERGRGKEILFPYAAHIPAGVRERSSDKWSPFGAWGIVGHGEMGTRELSGREARGFRGRRGRGSPGVKEGRGGERG